MMWLVYVFGVLSVCFCTIFSIFSGKFVLKKNLMIYLTYMNLLPRNVYFQMIRLYYGTIESRLHGLYEVCPKSIRPAFISSRQTARAGSAGYERNQWSLTNSLNAVVTGRTPWVAGSVCLCPTCFFRSSNFFTVENDRKNRSTNLHQVLLQSRQELYGDDWNDTEGRCGRKYGHNTDKAVVQAV